MHTWEGVDVNRLGGNKMLGEEEDVGASSNFDADNLESAESIHMEEEDGSAFLVEEHGLEAFIAAPEDHLEAGVDGVGFHHNIPACEPRTGMEFETKEAAYSFYREYARSVGFGITIRASRRSKKSGKFIDVKIACSRFGIKRESDNALNPRSGPKTNCRAGMHMKRGEDEIWVIHSFVKEHNHEICPDDFYQSIRGTNKQFGVAARPKKGLQATLDEDDVQVMLENFVSMQAENPNFFYAIDLDHGKSLRNVLWVDPKAAHDYSSFCDIVFFDTFYVSNRYHLPFVPIVGVNNHCQYILLGSALIGNQTASNYSWVMQTWLRAVGGKSPWVIITDQDKSLVEAVADAFPESRHCFCLWHVLSKIPENLGHVIDKHENFRKEFDKCIHQSLTGQQFESQWEKLVSKFELGGDDWVSSLYENRRKWVPVYMQDACLAGISTASCSVSIVTFFNRYIRKETTVKEFMEKSKLYLRERYEMEAAAEAEACGIQLSLRSLSPFEKQMSAIYTSAVFKLFQDEVLGLGSCHLQRGGEDEAAERFQCKESGNDRDLILHWDEKQLKICCSCRTFEYRGFLCRHAMLVLQVLGISRIPPRYILKRWTKDAKIRQTSGDESNVGSCRLQRFNDLCRRAVKLGHEASFSQEAYDIAFQALQEALRNCVGVNDSVTAVTEPSSTTAQGSTFAGEAKRGNISGKSSKKKKYKKPKVYGEAEQVHRSSQQEPSSFNPRAEEISSSDAFQKGCLETTSNTTSDRII